MVADDENEPTLFFRRALEYHGFEVEIYNDQ